MLLAHLTLHMFVPVQCSALFRHGWACLVYRGHWTQHYLCALLLTGSHPLLISQPQHTANASSRDADWGGGICLPSDGYDPGCWLLGRTSSEQSVHRGGKREVKTLPQAVWRTSTSTSYGGSLNSQLDHSDWPREHSNIRPCSHEQRNNLSE